MANGELGLRDDEFWGDYTRTGDEVLERLSERDFLGLVIDAPAVVAIDARATAPVVGWWIRTFREDRLFDAASQTVMCAVDLSTNEVRAGLALDTGKTPAEPPPPSDEDPGEGKLMEMIEADARSQVGLPWRPGRHAVTLLLQDKVSNTVTLQLVEADVELGAVPPPETLPAPRAWPATGEVPWPSYQATPESPPLPDAVGINLAGGEVTVGGDDEPCLLRGSFRLPVLPHEHNRPPDRDEGASPEGYEPAATAVVGIAIVLTGSDAVGPFMVPLRVPSYTAYDAEQGDMPVTGYFTVDLLRMPSMPRSPMTYFAYAFSGEAVAGPVPVTLVAKGSPPPSGA
jgi:hypothetical protein